MFVKPSLRSHKLSTPTHLSLLKKKEVFFAASSLSSTISLACFFQSTAQTCQYNSSTKAARKINEDQSFFAVSYDSYVHRPRSPVYTYNLSGIQFPLQNDSVDVIEAGWKWIQTGSVNLH